MAIDVIADAIELDDKTVKYSSQKSHAQTRADASTPPTGAASPSQPPKEQPVSTMSQEQTTPPSSSSPPSPPLDTNFSKKSLLVAYLYWLVGGVFGLHHLYLGRKHAFIVYSTTFGLLFTGTLHDLFVLPRYVEEYNCEHAYKEILKTRIKVRPEPYAGMFSLRYYAQLFVGLVYGGLLSCVLQWWEQELPADLNVHYLFTCKVLFYIGAAVGVYLVGSIGHVREGSLASTLHRGFYAFILCLLLRIGSEGEEDWNSNNLVIVAGCVMGFNASLAYQPEAATPVPLRKAQREEKRLQQGRGCCARQVVSCLRPWKYLSVVLVVYALIGNAFICNMEVEADGGGKVLVRDMLRSVVGEELLQPFRELYVYVRVNGLYNVLSEICQEVFAEEPEAAAFALFGFDADDDSVTLKDVKKRWKAMVLEWHPDKYQGKDVSLAEKKFDEVTKAYKLLQDEFQKRKAQERTRTYDRTHYQNYQ